MASRKSRPPSPSSRSSSPTPRTPRIPPPGRHRSRSRGFPGKDDNSFSPSPSPRQRRRRSRGPGYNLPGGSREKPNKIDLLFCVFHGAGSHKWRTAPYHFNPRRMDDRELWEDIRGIYREELQRGWRRWVLFNKLKSISPIEYSRNSVPQKSSNPQDPSNHSFMHAYHHPSEINPSHEWIDFFTRFRDQDPSKTYGLEFCEGLWAEKLAAVAVLVTIAIIVVSVVWCVRGGDLQTVFTVMGFVLSGAAAEVALVALYYQVTQPG